MGSQPYLYCHMVSCTLLLPLLPVQLLLREEEYCVMQVIAMITLVQAKHYRETRYHGYFNGEMRAISLSKAMAARGMQRHVINCVTKNGKTRGGIQRTLRSPLVAVKMGMTSAWDDNGAMHPVTLLQVQQCQVVQVKTEESDGYFAMQVRCPRHFLRQ